MVALQAVMMTAHSSHDRADSVHTMLRQYPWVLWKYLWGSQAKYVNGRPGRVSLETVSDKFSEYFDTYYEVLTGSRSASDLDLGWYLII
jgi:hypothetical protein